MANMGCNRLLFSVYILETRRRYSTPYISTQICGTDRHTRNADYTIDIDVYSYRTQNREGLQFRYVCYNSHTVALLSPLFSSQYKNKRGIKRC